MSNDKTLVIFRVWTGVNKFGTRPEPQVIALFPAVDEGNGYCSSYEHVGQHGGADYRNVMRGTRAATAAEFTPLMRELQGIGYKLDVRKRYVRRQS